MSLVEHNPAVEVERNELEGSTEAWRKCGGTPSLDVAVASFRSESTLVNSVYGTKLKCYALTGSIMQKVVS